MKGYPDVRPDRDAYFEHVRDAMISRGAYCPSRMEWEAKNNVLRDYILKAMSIRQCPMTLDGVVRVVCGPDPIGAVEKTRYLTRELVRDRLLAVLHRPDGDDWYYVPGGPSDPRSE